MYSIVLLAAMTTGGDVPACHNKCGGGHSHRHHGCSGCGGHGHRQHGCFGGCGGHGFFSKHRHHNGCCGAPVCCEAPAPVCGCCGTAAPAVEEKKEAEEGDEEMKEEESKADAPAKLIVRVPAAATLTIDGNATKSASARRVFVSPTLTAGKVYTYTLQAEVNAQTITKTVEVRAGETTTVELTIPAAVASR